MSIDFQDGVGFIVFVDLPEQEKLFQQLFSVFKRLDWDKEGAFFNYYGKDKESEPHAKIWVRANQSIIREVKESISNSNLEEKKTINECSVHSYVVCSKDQSNLSEFDNFDDSNLWLIKIKEAGTKYALEIKNELNITINTLTNIKLQEITAKIIKDRPEMIKRFVEFHFVLNPLVHFDTRGRETEEQVRKRCIIGYLNHEIVQPAS